MNVILPAVVGLFLAGADDNAPSFKIQETVAVGSQVQTRLHLLISGEIAAEENKQPLAGQALLEYAERVLSLDENQLPQRVARYYTDARAKFVVGRSEDPRQLRPDLRFIVGAHEDLHLALWSPSGPLTGDERELVEDVIDTTRLSGLLPKEEVKVGEDWQPADNVVQALCALDGLLNSEVTGKVDKIVAGKATLKLAGPVHGFALGAEVKIAIDATLVVDVEDGLIEQVEWKQDDQRSICPTSPPGKYSVKIAITRKREESRFLADDVLKTVSLEPSPGSQLIVFHDPGGQYRFFHGRNWHVTVVRPDVAITRLMKNGDFVAQLNINVLQERNANTKMKPEELQALVERSGDWKVEQIIRVDSLPTDGSHHVQMLAAYGKGEEKTRILQKHYLATARSGKQVLFTFILSPDQEDALGTDDLTLIGSIEFPEPTAKK